MCLSEIGWNLRANNACPVYTNRPHDRKLAPAVALLTEVDIFIPVTVVLALEWVLRYRYALAPKVVAQAIAKITALGNVVVGERQAVLSAASRAAQGWDFAVELCRCAALGLERRLHRLQHAGRRPCQTRGA